MIFLTEQAKATVKRLRDAAEIADNQLSLADVLTQRLANPSQFDDILVGSVEWYVGYGIEHQPIGPVRHLSISHNNRRDLPDADTVKALMAAFDFDFDEPVDPRVSVYARRGLTAHLMQAIKPIP